MTSQTSTSVLYTPSLSTLRNPLKSRLRRRGEFVERLFQLCRFAILLSGSSIVCFGTAEIENGATQSTLVLPAEIETILSKSCMDCHDADVSKGDVRLDVLEMMSLNARLKLLNRMHEQLFFKQMPPEKKKQLTTPQSERLIGWISDELGKNKAAKLEEKLQHPKYGNYIDHEMLFSGKFKNLKGFTYDRHWLISEFIFNQKMNELLNRKPRVRDKRVYYELQNESSGFANPFALPNESGVRYYANEQLTGGHFLTMVGNAKSAADIMIDSLNTEQSDYLPAAVEIMSKSLAQEKVLQTRREFLQRHVHRLCQELYKAENAIWLPKAPPIVLPVIIEEKATSYGKWGFRNRIGYLEGAAIHETMRVVGVEDKSKKELIEQCARYWYHAGECKDAIDRRIYLLCKEVSSLLKGTHDKIRPYTYKPLNDLEMAEITSAIRMFRTKGMPYKQIVEKCVAHWQAELREHRERSRDISDELEAQLLDQFYDQVHHRQPTSEEKASQSLLFRAYVKELGEVNALKKLAQTLILRTEFIVRDEFGVGQPDAHG